MLKPISLVVGSEPVEKPRRLPEPKPDSGSAYGRCFLIIHKLEPTTLKSIPLMMKFPNKEEGKL